MISINDVDGLSITKITGVEGDVSVNQRKGRVKQLFDLEISFEYSASDSTGTGFITEFTADYEDPSDLNLKLTPNHAKKESLLMAVGRVAEEFKKELFEVHGKPLLLQAQESQNQSEGANANINSSESPSLNTSEATKQPVVTKVDISATTAVVSEKPTKSTVSTAITDEVTFPCPPEQLYLMLTDSVRIRSWSRSPVTLPQILLPQAPFSLFDGNISGKFLTLKSPNLIEMEWKLKSWSQSSCVSIEISAEEGGNGQKSVLKMKQINVPSGEAEIIKSNWHNYYWSPIKRAFGVIL